MNALLTVCLFALSALSPTLATLSEELVLFDVCSSASVSDLKASLSDFDIRHSFHVIGSDQYLFVVVANRDAEEALTFPSGKRWL